MRCTDPYTKHGEAFPCGKCPLCRNSQAGKWTTRIALERSQWDHAAFLTLTLEEKELEYPSSKDYERIFPTLVKRDLQLFLKRLRERVPQKLRYYAVGEYGGSTLRPHYHVGLFNYPNCERNETLKSLRSKRCLWRECCGNCRLVGDCWGKGDIEVRDLDGGKCQYLAGYIAQKRVKKQHWDIFGLAPEFSTQSRGGRQAGAVGIGGLAVKGIASTIRQYVAEEDLIDVPGELHQGPKKKLILDRYMKQKLRENLGIEKAADILKHQTWQEQVQPVLAFAAKNNMGLKEAFRLVNGPYEEALLKRQRRKGKI